MNIQKEWMMHIVNMLHNWTEAWRKDLESCPEGEKHLIQEFVHKKKFIKIQKMQLLNVNAVIVSVISWESKGISCSLELILLIRQTIRYY